MQSFAHSAAFWPEFQCQVMPPPSCCRLEVDSDVISGIAVDNVSMDVPIKFGNSRSNGFTDIRGADFVSNE